MSVRSNYSKISSNLVVVNTGEVIITAKLYFAKGYHGIFDVPLKDGHGQ